MQVLAENLVLTKAKLENGCSIRMNNVNKLSIRGIKMNDRIGIFKQWTGRIETYASTNMQNGQKQREGKRANQ